MVKLFLDGGPFMWPILITLAFGIMFALERFWALSRAAINSKKFVIKVNKALMEGGPDKAMEICSKTRGPVASILHAGLLRANRGIDAVEKAVSSAGTIEMAFLEKNLVWLATVIAMAPMLGFTGTVAGMVDAFNSIAAANDISPSIVAGGISQALLTTLFGLIVAMIIQVFHNYFVSRVDKLVIDMEESTTSFVDSLVELQQHKEK
ncbi:MotA/TolQ/ExbB proton channel family protein [bacterium]|nr:MotA/TolQ/ExbB proton channel family protein [FCB group bacterium]MBL7191383.1 MotA/TolQ/ExbB proton channel family protein [bacterium]